VISLYQITNLLNGKKYFGKTSLTPERRWWKHQKDARAGRPWAISRAIRKYGAGSFKIEVLFSVDTEQQANDAERGLIASGKTNLPAFGYNNTLGGDGFSCPNGAFLKRMKEAQHRGIHAPGAKRSRTRFGHGGYNSRFRSDVHTDTIIHLYIVRGLSPRAIARETGFKGALRRLCSAGVPIRGRADVALGRPRVTSK